MKRSLAGAVTGAVTGLAAGAVGELLVLLIAQMFPTDVLISGFAMIWAVPSGLVVGAVSSSRGWPLRRSQRAGVVVGAVCGWGGWLLRRSPLAAVAAVPGLLAGVAAALMQWSAV